MLKVGLTGSIAVGKSFVLSMLGELGCVTFDADRIAHSVMEPGPVVGVATGCCVLCGRPEARACEAAGDCDVGNAGAAAGAGCAVACPSQLLITCLNTTSAAFRSGAPAGGAPFASVASRNRPDF